MKTVTPKILPNKTENPILGKRHDHKNAPEENLKTKATELGFSSDEIKQLLRLYNDN